VTDIKTRFNNNEITEGLVIPQDILHKCDILPWEQIIVTKINGDNWINRLKTFAIPGDNNGKVEARGSLSMFLRPGDLTCLISFTTLNEEQYDKYKTDKIPLLDLGFDPENNKDNLIKSRLDIEYCSSKLKDVNTTIEFTQQRESLKRFRLSSLVLGLTINKTHPDCLQGSAELPGEIMEKANLLRFQSVSVYNATLGGIADTYSVPMPKGVVMTTGAMAKFAKIGESVNIAAYALSTKAVEPTIVNTDGRYLIE
jgi:aspartate 1-decarboxylase